MAALQDLSRQLNRGVEVLLVAMGMVMATVVATQVFARYALNHSLFWSEELARYLLVWLSFLGASSAYYRGVHPGVDVLYSRLPPQARRAAMIAVHLASLLLFGVMVVYGWQFAAFVRLQISPALHLPKWIPHAIIPLSGAVLAVHALGFLLRDLAGEGTMTAEILLGCLVVLFALNAPIAIAIGVASILAIAAQGSFPPMVVVQRMFAGTDSFHLLAVPLFMFAGVLMERGGISRRIIDFANALVGWLPGGLAAVTIVSAMFFAGISGSAAADAAAVGAILIPAMKRSGYDSDFAAAVQASGGSIGVIIPPSIPMIIFGFLTGASIGQLFAAGILPGLLIGLSLIAAATLISHRRGYAATQAFSLAEVWQTFRGAVLALGAPAIILGGILFGVFTATESAAVAVVYALVVSLFVYREVKVTDLFAVFRDGAVTSAIVMFIIATASIFSWIAAIEDIPARLAGSLLGLTQEPSLLLLLVNAVLLIAGTFVETTAALILLVPLITAMLPSLGIDLVQLGAIVVVNLAIGMLTPPMGICLIVSSSISGDSLGAVSRRILPFLAVLLVDLLLISFWSPLTTWLPSLMR